MVFNALVKKDTIQDLYKLTSIIAIIATTNLVEVTLEPYDASVLKPIWSMTCKFKNTKNLEIYHLSFFREKIYFSQQQPLNTKSPNSEFFSYINLQQQELKASPSLKVLQQMLISVEK